MTNLILGLTSAWHLKGFLTFILLVALTNIVSLVFVDRVRKQLDRDRAPAGDDLLPSQ